MALDTIPTPISHETVALYLAKLDERGETYQFDVNSPTYVGRGKLGPINLVLGREGTQDCLEVTLNMDGTWNASHALVVGEKE